MEKNRNYQTFLLRLWREGKDAPWRYALKDSQTDRQFNFGDLNKLATYLDDQLNQDESDFCSDP